MHEPPPPIRDGGFYLAQWVRLVLASGPEQTSTEYLERQINIKVTQTLDDR